MRIEIFSAPSCVSCDFAKEYLQKHRLEFVEFNIGSAASMAAFRSRVSSFKPIPQFLIDGRPIEGYAELRQHLRGDKVK